MKELNINEIEVKESFLVMPDPDPSVEGDDENEEGDDLIGTRPEDR